MRAKTEPVPWLPLSGDIAVQVQAVFVFRGQFVEVGAVLTEALGRAQAGLQHPNRTNWADGGPDFKENIG